MHLLYVIRKENGYTQEEMSRILKVSQSCISKIEEGRMKPNVLIIARLWNVFPDRRNSLDKYFKDILR